METSESPNEMDGMLSDVSASLDTEGMLGDMSASLDTEGMLGDVSTSLDTETGENTDSKESESSSLKKKQVTFSGSCSFVVSLLGYSMGTSDFWRFPYVVFRNGGGAFLIPFALTMLICGLPLFFLEISMSQFSGKGSMSVWKISPFFKGIGFTLLGINLLNNVYYNILRAWVMEYLVGCFRAELPWRDCSNEWNRPGCITTVGTNYTSPENGTIKMAAAEQFGNYTSPENVTQMTAAEQFWQYRVLQLSSGLDDLDGILWHFVLYIFIWRLLVTLCMIKSIKSIEKVMFVTVFVPIVLMLALWVRSLMLEGSVAGMLYYLTPTFDRISDPKVWLEAAMMACYTLGPGWGTLPMIGSHNKFSSNCLKYSIITTVCDCISAIMNGLICFSILGVMAHDSGLDLEKTVTSGLALGFTVYPTAFIYFPFPQIWAGLFFINLLLVGLDSQILSAETVMNCFQDLFPKWFLGKRRKYMVVVLNCLAFLCTIPLCTRGGCYIFQLLDWYAVAWSILFVSFVEFIVFMWVYGGDRISEDLTLMLGRPLPHLLRLSAAFITPAIVLLLLVLSFMKYEAPSYGTYKFPPIAEVIGWTLAIAVVMPVFICFIVKFIRSSGTLDHKIREVSKSSEKWLPNDIVYEEKYLERNSTISNFRDVVLFNITGKHRRAVESTVNEISMAKMISFEGVPSSV